MRYTTFHHSSATSNLFDTPAIFRFNLDFSWLSVEIHFHPCSVFYSHLEVLESEFRKIAVTLLLESFKFKFIFATKK